MFDDRVYAECTICSWGCSGPSRAVDDKVDAHIDENPDHKINISEIQNDN